MATLEQMLPQFYQELHAKGTFMGNSWQHHLADFVDFLGMTQAAADEVVLDYGCGPIGGLCLEPPRRVLCYDPYVKEYCRVDWGAFQTVFSCDVLEHMPVLAISHLLRQLEDNMVVKRLYFAVTARPANKVLPNGLNVHVTCEPAEWWYGLLRGSLGRSFEIKRARADLLDGECVFGLVRREAS